jgi:hypothetical protein
LGGLVRELAVAHLAVVSEMDCAAQAVEGLTLVELASDPFAHFGALEVAQDEQCLDQPAILLQRGSQGVLSGEGQVTEPPSDQTQGASVTLGW